ncbi:putative UDP-N-acetylglucosamine diphosphorylase 2-like [Capsicum annuum]|nr:putative UDP-N-acetylglucosamine diphosphorylase 2-like [Capsicum annuum]
MAEVLPDSRHCFLFVASALSNIQEKLGRVIRQHESFQINKCILRSATNELFKKRWWKVVDRFIMRNELWIKSLYEDRLRWAPTYMNNIFLAVMSTMPRAESVSSLLDKCILCKTILKEFLDQYEKLLQEKRQGEANADFETRHKQTGLKSPSPFEGDTYRLIWQLYTLIQYSRNSKLRVQRYNDLCQKAFELGDEGSLSQESFSIVGSVLESFLGRRETVKDPNLSESEPCSFPNQGLNDLEVFTDSNNPSKSNGENITRKEKVGNINSRIPIPDGYYGSGTVEYKYPRLCQPTKHAGAGD